MIVPKPRGGHGQVVALQFEHRDADGERDQAAALTAHRAAAQGETVSSTSP